MGAIFWIGKKVGENKPQSSLSNQILEQKIATTQNQLATVKKQLAKETNSDQKAKLETKIKQLEQEIVNLKKWQNPPPPTPPNNPPVPPTPIPPQNPVPPSDLISTIWKWSASDKSGYQLFDSDKNNKFKVYIATDHPLIKGKKLDSSEDTHPFSIRFNKKNASRQEGDKTFYFEKDNSNLELNPFGNWPDEENKIEAETVFSGDGYGKDEIFYCFSLFNSSSTNEFKLFYINQRIIKPREITRSGIR